MAPTGPGAPGTPAALPDHRHRSTRPRLVVAVLLVLVLGIGAWWATNRSGDDIPPVQTDATSPLTQQCPGVSSDVLGAATRVQLTAADGGVLGAAVTGAPSAPVGLVLRPGSSQTLCEWLPIATRLSTASGARVLIFDRRGMGSSSQLTYDLTLEPSDTRVAYSRMVADGTKQLAVAGSSLGNAAMFAALPELSPSPCAVISVSPVLSATSPQGTVDPGAAGLPGLTDVTWVVHEERNDGVVTAVAQIVAAAKAQAVHAPEVLAIDTNDHSRQLVLNHPEAYDFILRALRSCSA